MVSFPKNDPPPKAPLTPKEAVEDMERRAYQTVTLLLENIVTHPLKDPSAMSGHLYMLTIAARLRALVRIKCEGQTVVSWEEIQAGAKIREEAAYEGYKRGS